MNGRDTAHHAWSKERYEASLSRRKTIKGKLTLSAEPAPPTA
jgi:hypothetical protein